MRSVFFRACKDHELGPGLSGGDAEQVLDLLFYRARRQMQPGRDLLVRDAWPTGPAMDPALLT